MSPFLGLLASTVALATEPSIAVETGQRIAFAGAGMSTVGAALVVTGGFAFYKGPFDAVERYQGGRDPQKTEPGTAIASGLVVGSGLGISAIGRPVLSLGSALTARTYRAEGGKVSPTLGWVSVGAWAAGVGTYFAAQSTGAEYLDWAWAGLRLGSTSTGIVQLIQTRNAMHGTGAASHRRATPSVQLVLGPNNAAVVGRF